VFAETAAETVHRFLALAYEGRLAELPKTDDADTAAFERNVRNTLRVRCARIEAIRVVELTANDEQTIADIDVALEKIDKQHPDAWRVTDIIPLRVTLTRGADRWLVSAVEYPDIAFAEELLRADREEQRRLLLGRQQRVNKSLARVLHDKAVATMNAGRFAEAARITDLVHEVAVFAGDRGGESLALSMAPFAKDIPDPNAMLDESLAIAESLGEPDVLARAWYSLTRGRGFKYWEARQAGGTGDYTRKSREYAERAEDPGLLTRVLYSMANSAANTLSDFVAARRYIDLALPVARESGDPPVEAGLETVLSSIYFRQGDLERGLFHHERALKLAEKHQLYSYATLRMRSAWALVEQRRFDEARAEFAKTLFRDAEGMLHTVGPAPSSHIGTAVVSMAKMEAETGRLDQAECLVREAARYFRSPENAFLFELGPYFLERNEHATALRFALSSLADTGLYSSQRLTALEVAARAYRGLGDSDRAMATALEAMEIRESINARTAGDEQQRARMADGSAMLYELAAELALDRGDASHALAFLERGRAFVLTGILEHGRIASAGEKQEQSRREAELAQLSVELDRARGAGKSAEADRLSEKLRAARAEYATYIDGIHARAERQMHPRRSAADAICDLQKRLEPGVVAVEYLVGDRQIHLFVVDAKRIRHRTIDIERNVLEKRVDAFVHGIAARDLEFRAPARELYDLLIAPIGNELANAEVLLLVPHDVLWRVPFAALIDRRGEFLAERWASLYAPSLTAYAMIAASKSARTANQTALFGIANPRIEQASKDAVASVYRGTDLGPLPDAEEELDRVQALYGSRSIVLKGAEATEARTKREVRGAEVLHFATHALFDDTNPMYSRLALAHDQEAAEDGWLETWEIAQMDLPADIVVLSACETARGRIGRGEGVVGMTWAFFVAGARSVVATQWKVVSVSASRFMVDFHRSLRAKGGDHSLRKARALRDAQLRHLGDPLSSHPYYWAPFVLLGDPSSRP
jgi:CHAT domain-containing protein